MEHCAIRAINWINKDQLQKSWRSLYFPMSDDCFWLALIVFLSVVCAGHTFAWGYGQNHLLTPCYDYHGKPSGKYGPVNPTLKKNYRFLKTLFQEVLTV